MKRFFRTSGGDGGVDNTCLRGAALTRPPYGCICHTQVRRTRSILARLPRLVTVFTDAVPDPPGTGAPNRAIGGHRLRLAALLVDTANQPGA